MSHVPEHRLREELVKFGRLCYERHLLVAMDGNLSALLPDGNVLCTKAGCHKGFLTDDDLVVIDRGGRKLRGSGNPTSEMAMHLACYDERPDIRSVIHTHPPISIAFTIAGVSMARCVLPEVVLTLGTVPTVEYATTGTKSLADGIRPYVRHHDAVLMDRHGAVCLGKDVLTALFSWFLAGAPDSHQTLRTVMARIDEENVPMRSMLDLVLDMGHERGVQQGMQQGLEALRQVLAGLLQTRFGELSAPHAARLAAADLPTLQAWGARLLRVDRIDRVFAAVQTSVTKVRGKRRPEHD
jgi:L-fuculose-phosphate aldolase